MPRDSKASRRAYYRAYCAANREKIRAYQRAWKKRNAEKVRKYARDAYAKNPATARDKNLRRKFGISLQEYNALRIAQKDTCAVCGVGNPGGKGDWHLDHDHKSGKARELLCQNCNIGLGNFKDDPSLLTKAARYLRKHS